MEYQNYNKDIVPEKEKERENETYLTVNSQVTIVAPPTAKLPRNATACIMKVHPDRTYDILIQSGTVALHKNVPYEYLRPNNILCRGKKVLNLTAGQLLEGRNFILPTYQRRYAWQPQDWNSLWSDLGKPRHRMGQLTLFEKESGNIHVVDGQQRITTLNLLLSAILGKAVEQQRQDVIEEIEQLFFTDQEKYKRWMEAEAHKMTPEGAVLDFYRQIPTYIDRKPFYLALIGVKTDSLIWQGRQFFSKMLENHLQNSKQDLGVFLHSVLDNLVFLYFEVFNNGQDVSLYEGLCVRSEGLKKAFNISKDHHGIGQGMKTIDLIRNFMLDFYPTEEEKMDFYQKHWVPLERIKNNQIQLEESTIKFILLQIPNQKVKEAIPLFEVFVDWLLNNSQIQGNLSEKSHQVISMLTQFVKNN